MFYAIASLAGARIGAPRSGRRRTSGAKTLLELARGSTRRGTAPTVTRALVRRLLARAMQPSTFMSRRRSTTARTATAAFVPALVLGLGACDPAGPPAARSTAHASPGTLPVGAPRSQDSDDAIVERLSEARCTREAWCQTVGVGTSYASVDACLATMRARLGDAINPRTCPRGVDGVELERCALAIQREECGHPADTASRIDRCRSSAICM